MRMLLAILTLSACQHTNARLGPSPDEMVAILRSAPPELASQYEYSVGRIRSLRCRAFEEEPTEFKCRFEAKGPTDGWLERSVIVAADGAEWVLLE